MKWALRFLVVLMIVAVVLNRTAWLVQAASEDANSAKHVRSLLVDTSGEAITPLTDTQLRATPVPVSGTLSLSSGTVASLTPPTAAAIGTATSNPFTSAGDGTGTKPGPLLSSVKTNTDCNARGTAAVALTKATWTALSGIGNGSHRYLQIVLTDDTASESAVVHVWGSPDGGTTWFPMVRADTLADAKDVTLAVGTYRPAAAGNYSASVVVAAGPATHIYLTEKTAPAAGTYSYKIGGL